jgi:uncharacterized protein
MSAIIQHKINNQNFILHYNRVLFWEEEKILILSDTHFGKTNHFRKSGIAIPTNIVKEDFQRLTDAIQFFKPSTIIIVGDLFHSIENKEHTWFAKWRKDFTNLKFILVKGNHDIVEESWYKNAAIEVIDSFYKIHNIVFVHQLSHYQPNQDEYLISGHIHPAISIKGLGKQSLRFPCFYFTANYAVLPAFGKFTGTFSVEPKKKEQVFAVVNNSVVRV